MFCISDVLHKDSHQVKENFECTLLASYDQASPAIYPVMSRSTRVDYCWTPGLDWKGPAKKGPSALPSVCKFSQNWLISFF